MSILRSTAFTLIELMISISLLGMVMVIVTMSLDTSSRFNDRFSRQTDINNRANDVLNKVAMQLRLASTGSTAATSLELPGPYPLGFVPKDPSKSANVTAYYFSVSTGLGDALNDWAEKYEPYKRMIIYDYSVVPGRILLQARDASGNPLPVQLLSEDVAENGFSLTRIGNTLQMSLTLRSQTRVKEEIIYTALAQTLFLRSTLNKSSGPSSMSFFANKTSAEGNNESDTSSAPNVMFGNLVTVLSSGQKQMSVFITAPIGKKIDPKSIVVSCGASDDLSAGVEVDEGATVGVMSGMTVTRATYPPPSQWPSRNGTYSVTLTGDVSPSVKVTVRVSNTDGQQADAFKKYQ